MILIASKNFLGFLGPVRLVRGEADQFFRKDRKYSLVWFVDIVDGDDGEIAVVTEVTKSNSSAGLDVQFIDLLLVHVQSNWHAEKVAIG